jgi:hypothetical protein
VEKSSGRHRKRRQGRGEHMRWVLGAVLAAVFCSTPVRNVPPVPKVRRPLPARRPQTERATVSRRGPGENPGSSSKAWPRGGGGTWPVAVPRPRVPYAGRRGWCVDDEGVRGVRPYLAREEERVSCALWGVRRSGRPWRSAVRRW